MTCHEYKSKQIKKQDDNWVIYLVSFLDLFNSPIYILPFIPLAVLSALKWIRKNTHITIYSTSTSAGVFRIVIILYYDYTLIYNGAVQGLIENINVIVLKI